MVRAARVAAWCVGLASVAGPCSFAHTACAAGRVEVQAVAEDVVRRTNDLRVKEGRGAVQPNERLARTAHDFAAFLARNDRFTHDADGREPPQRAEQHGYVYCVVSENIGYEQRRPEFTSAELARALFEGWENSPPHRRNLLDAAVTETGFGLAQSSRTTRWYAVHLFGAPESARTEFQVTNEAGSPVRYRLGDETFDLPPRYTRTHSECRPRPLSVLPADRPNEPPVEPRAGERYAIVRQASGSVGLAKQ